MLQKEKENNEKQLNTHRQ